MYIYIYTHTYICTPTYRLMPRQGFVFNTLLEPSQNLLLGCTRQHCGSAPAARLCRREAPALALCRITIMC